MAYIDKEKAIAEISSLKTSGAFSETFKDTVLRTLEQEPAADVVEVRHGEWVYGEFDIPHCSECGVEVMPNNISNYCPHCGAKMDGKDGE